MIKLPQMKDLGGSTPELLPGSDVIDPRFSAYAEYARAVLRGDPFNLVDPEFIEELVLTVWRYDERGARRECLGPYSNGATRKRFFEEHRKRNAALYEPVPGRLETHELLQQLSLAHEKLATRLHAAGPLDIRRHAAFITRQLVEIMNGARPYKPKRRWWQWIGAQTP